MINIAKREYRIDVSGLVVKPFENNNNKRNVKIIN
jgi:hypothetical protein